MVLRGWSAADHPLFTECNHTFAISVFSHFIISFPFYAFRFPFFMYLCSCNMQ